MMSREQRLVDIVFEVVFAVASEKFTETDRDKIGAWTAKQLNGCGFPTTPAGCSWGVLDNERVKLGGLVSESTSDLRAELLRREPKEESVAGVLLQEFFENGWPDGWVWDGMSLFDDEDSPVSPNASYDLSGHYLLQEDDGDERELFTFFIEWWRARKPSES